MIAVNTSKSKVRTIKVYTSIMPQSTDMVDGTG